MPLDPPAAYARHQQFVREMTGLLLVLAGAAVLLWVLATVDWRWPVGVAAAGAVAGGIYLGRDRAEIEGS